MRIAYLECFSGISGDMFLGALIDAGVPPEVFTQTVAALGVDARLEISRVDRSGISATKLDVIAAGEKELPREEFWQEALSSQQSAASSQDSALSSQQSAFSPARVSSGGHSHDHGHSHGDEESHSHSDEHSHSHEHSHGHEHGYSVTQMHPQTPPRAAVPHEHGHSHSHEHHDPHEQNHSHEHSHEHGS